MDAYFTWKLKMAAKFAYIWTMLGSIALFLALANATILNDVRNHYGLKNKDGDYYLFLAEHLPRLAFGMGRPSVVCLLSVSSVHPTDRTFWQYFRIM